MTNGEIERVAGFLAAHAILFLAAGIVLAIIALASVVGAIHLLRGYRDRIRRTFISALDYARQFDVFERSLTRSRAFLPGPYLAVHLILGLAVTAAVTVFVVIAQDVVGHGATVTFDLAFARALRDSATPRWTRMFTIVSWLGSGYALAVATALVAVYLGRQHDRLAVLGWTAAQAGGWLLNYALKAAFERTRPSFADPLLAASSWSFPSGHAMGTFILLGVGSYVVLRNVRSWSAAAVVVTLTLSWCVVMAFSRLYLGVHFASDVVAGLIAGVAWVAVCASAFEVIRSRRTISAPAVRLHQQRKHGV